MKKLIPAIIIGVVLLASIVAILWNSKEARAPREVIVGDAYDIALDFYAEWLASVTANAPTTTLALASDPRLALALQTSLDSALKTGTTTDPVLCSTEAITGFRAKNVFETASSSQMMMLARLEDDSSKAVAIVDLENTEFGWNITAINCYEGEVAPEREFSFEQKGFLLKNVLPPLDSNFWHLVYEQDGQTGYTVPLLLSSNSFCAIDGAEPVVCNPSELIEASAATVKANLLETGAEVVLIEITRP